jgi:hypothetical protein
MYAAQGLYINLMTSYFLFVIPILLFMCLLLIGQAFSFIFGVIIFCIFITSSYLNSHEVTFTQHLSDQVFYHAIVIILSYFVVRSLKYQQDQNEIHYDKDFDISSSEVGLDTSQINLLLNELDNEIQFLTHRNDHLSSNEDWQLLIKNKLRLNQVYSRLMEKLPNE